MTGLEGIRDSKRVLFVHQYLAMGDAVLLSTVYSTLKENIAGVEISVLTNRYSMPFVEALSSVDRVYCLEPLLGGGGRAMRLMRLCRFFLRGRFDTIGLRGDERMPQRGLEAAARICRLRRVHMGPALRKEVRKDRHIVDTYLKILEDAGFSVKGHRGPVVEVPGRSLVEARKFLKGPAARLIGVAPVSNMKIKNWPPSLTSELIKRLEDKGYDILLFCADEAFLEGVRKGCGSRGHGFRTVGIVDFGLLRGLVSECRGFIGVDTGLTHLAAALGVPTLGLYGPTSGVIAGPYGPGNRALQAPGECPYYRPMALFSPGEKMQECYQDDECRFPIPNCVERIGVEVVEKAFVEMMKGQEKACHGSAGGAGKTGAGPSGRRIRGRRKSAI